jgi:hypothetical protein
VASVPRIGRADDGEPPRRYVASLLWPARLPRTANDNRHTWTAVGVLSLAASAALLAAAVWAAVT